MPGKHGIQAIGHQGGGAAQPFIAGIGNDLLHGGFGFVRQVGAGFAQRTFQLVKAINHGAGRHAQHIGQQANGGKFFAGHGVFNGLAFALLAGQSGALLHQVKPAKFVTHAARSLQAQALAVRQQHLAKRALCGQLAFFDHGAYSLLGYSYNHSYIHLFDGRFQVNNHKTTPLGNMANSESSRQHDPRGRPSREYLLHIASPSPRPQAGQRFAQRTL